MSYQRDFANIPFPLKLLTLGGELGGADLHRDPPGDGARLVAGAFDLRDWSSRRFLGHVHDRPHVEAGRSQRRSLLSHHRPHCHHHLGKSR
jgi:hypothetical protein